MLRSPSSPNNTNFPRKNAKRQYSLEKFDMCAFGTSRSVRYASVRELFVWGWETLEESKSRESVVEHPRECFGSALSAEQG